MKSVSARQAEIMKGRHYLLWLSECLEIFFVGIKHQTQLLARMGSGVSVLFCLYLLYGQALGHGNYIF